MSAQGSEEAHAVTAGSVTLPDSSAAEVWTLAEPTSLKKPSG